MGAVVRSVVVLYLTFATAVGPWPCCCSAPPGSHPPTAADPSGSPRPPTCCHGAKPRPATASAGPAHTTAGKGLTGERTPPAPRPCDRHCCAVKARPDQTRPNTASSWALEPSPADGVFVPTSPPAAASPAAWAFDSDRPFLSAADRLYAHHVLRC